MLSRARVADENASITVRVELRPWPWVCCMLARMGSSFSSGSPPRSPASCPRSDQSGNLKSHNTDCLLIENDEQMAIACVGMADVNIQITLGISGEV